MMASRMHGDASGWSTNSKNPHENTHIFDKTRLCKFYAKGKCKRGQACTFAHGEVEVQAQPDFFRTQLCVDFVRSGACKAGSRCSYAHDPQELRHAKTHKSGRGQGLKKAADSQVSLEVRRLEMMQQEVTRLHSQLHTLQKLACSGSSVPSALRVEGRGRCKVVDEVQEEEDGEGLDLNTGFSRQSTEEGSEPPLCFSRQSTIEDCDEWDDSASALVSENTEHRLTSEAEEQEMEQEVACQLLVKRTFFSLEPVRAGSHRRSQSAHAARCFDFA